MGTRTKEATAEIAADPVTEWRYGALVGAGYSEPDALALAVRKEVDLHVACDLLRRQCPPELAVRILT